MLNQDDVVTNGEIYGVVTREADSEGIIEITTEYVVGRGDKHPMVKYISHETTEMSPSGLRHVWWISDKKRITLYKDGEAILKTFDFQGVQEFISDNGQYSTRLSKKKDRKKKSRKNYKYGMNIQFKDLKLNDMILMEGYKTPWQVYELPSESNMWVKIRHNRADNKFMLKPDDAIVTIVFERPDEGWLRQDVRVFIQDVLKVCDEY